MKISNYKPYSGTGALQGFFDVILDNEVSINGCSLFDSNGKQWISPPSKQYTNKAGETKYQNLVVFPKEMQEEIKKLALKEISVPEGKF